VIVIQELYGSYGRVIGQLCRSYPGVVWDAYGIYKRVKGKLQESLLIVMGQLVPNAPKATLYFVSLYPKPIIVLQL
jgi:hypothetical protein